MPDQPFMPVLTVRAIRATPVEVPPNFVLGTSRGAFRQVPLLLIDLETKEGVTGRSYLFCYLRAAAPAIMSLLGEVETVTNGDKIDPAALWGKLAGRFALIGVQGIVRMALAGFDAACWDALAIAAGQPLVRMLGADPKPIPAYNSCGLGLMEDLGALASGPSCSRSAISAPSSCVSAIRRFETIPPPCMRCANASATMCI